MVLFALLVPAETREVPFVCAWQVMVGHSYLSGKPSLISVCRNKVYSRPSILRCAEQMADGMGLGWG